jgi:uncharacterized protein (UPF0332 family)
MIDADRLAYAQRYLEDARLLFEHKRLGSSVSRLYYASYQAMWAALGDPHDGRIWRHLAVIKPFVHGGWYNPAYPQQAPGQLEHLRLPLRQLYAYRVKADYELAEFEEEAVKNMLKLVDDIIHVIQSK